MVLNFGGSFLGLIVFLIYLGGIIVVFGYTTAVATEQYSEIWVSNKTVLGAFITGLLMEDMMVYYVLKDEEVEIVFQFNGLGIGLFMIQGILDFLVRRLWGLRLYTVVVLD